MALEKYKTVDEWLQVGDLIAQADDQAIANGDVWKLVDVMRADRLHRGKRRFGE